MNTSRAKEIVNSLGVIEVLYNGSSVWIESVNEDSVQVKDLKTEQRFEVPADDLVEG